MTTKKSTRVSGGTPATAPSTSRSAAAIHPTLYSQKQTRSRKRAHSPTDRAPQVQKRTRRNNTVNPRGAQTKHNLPPEISDSEIEEDNNKVIDDVNESRSESETSDEEYAGLNSLGPTQARSLLHAEMPQVRQAPGSETSAPQATSAGITSEADALSRRNEQYQSEVPHWNERDNSEAPSQGSEALAQSQPRKLGPTFTEVNFGWPAEAHYVPPMDGARLISVKHQPGPLQTVLSKGERQATRMCLEQSFFIVHGTEYSALITLLVDIAEKQGLPHLASRLKQDRPFYQKCGRMLTHRLALRRGRIKSFATPLVGIRFGFEDHKSDPEWIKATANALIQESSYIFPVENGAIVRKRPYEHPVIIQTLSKYLFSGGRRSSLGEKYCEIFQSSLPEFHGQNEIPLSVLALVSTAVHHAISEWTTGTYYPSDFMSDVVENVFKGHQEWLASIRQVDIGKYHAMTHRIYKQCRNNSSVGAGVKQGITKIVDVEGMESASNDV